MSLTSRFNCGLVVGKFSPLHRGHEYLIQHALDQCHEVVVISYSHPEYPGCEADLRRRWLEERFPKTRRLVLDPNHCEDLATLPESCRSIPLNCAEPEHHRIFCGALCTHLLGCTVDAVFTSETYGDGFAEALTRWFSSIAAQKQPVRHIPLDPHRYRVPISGTVLRRDIHGGRQWMSPAVYRSFVRRICFLGGESTGKSTMARAMAEHLGTRYVGEYGRQLWEDRNGELKFEDLLHIAEVQVHWEEAAAEQAVRYLFCDTSPLTTLFYSKYMFGKADPGLERLAERRYDLVVLCEPDIPFIQDGTRQPEPFREAQHQWYVEALSARKIDYLSLRGGINERIEELSLVLKRVCD